jgi:tetrahydromethanopterin S-methyltransferase subunit F
MVGKVLMNQPGEYFCQNGIKMNIHVIGDRNKILNRDQRLEIGLSIG